MHVLPIMMIDFSLQTGVVEDSIGGTCMCQPKGSDDFEDEDFSIQLLFLSYLVNQMEYFSYDP